MRRLALALSLSVAACSWKVSAVGVGAGTLTMVIGAGADDGSQNQAGPSTTQAGAAVGMIIIIVALIGGAIGTAQRDPSRPTQDEHVGQRAPIDPDLPTTGERLLALVAEARAAAIARDCARVLEIDAEVRDLDAAFHARWFRTHTTIAACFPD